MHVAAPNALPDPAQALSQLAALLAAAQAENHALRVENQLLHQKVEALIRRYFGNAKNERLDPNQLELLLAGLTATAPAPEKPAPPVIPPVRSPARKPARSGIPDNLPQIEEVVTRELEWEAARFYWRHIVRLKFVRKGNALPPTPQGEPVAAIAAALAAQAVVDPPEVFIAALPNRLIEKGLPGVGLLVHLLVSRFVDHLPFYRLEQSFRQRHGVPLSRQSMVDWTEQLATWLQPIYRQMIVEALARRYLQADETPIRYLDRDVPGRSCQGYFWVYGPPGGNVIFEWQTSRGRAAPEAFLKNFSGKLQADGYAVYRRLVADRNAALPAGGAVPDLILFACWAHARRKFHEAKDHDRRTAWFLKQIGLLYALEHRLRQGHAGPRLRQAARAAEAAPILARIQRALDRCGQRVLPQSLLGKAIAYTRELWPHLIAYVAHGEVEIDNNLIENAIRPTAIGKKNFLFIGHPDAGWRSAVIYSIVASCRRYQIDPAKYLQDVLTRLPDLKQSQVPEITPRVWAKAHPEARTLPPK
jgi:hypothetical protein